LGKGGGKAAENKIGKKSVNPAIFEENAVQDPMSLRPNAGFHFQIAMASPKNQQSGDTTM